MRTCWKIFVSFWIFENKFISSSKSTCSMKFPQTFVQSCIFQFGTSSSSAASSMFFENCVKWERERKKGKRKKSLSIIQSTRASRKYRSSSKSVCRQSLIGTCEEKAQGNCVCWVELNRAIKKYQDMLKCSNVTKGLMLFEL